MAWRKTGKMSEPFEINIKICDQCHKDIGHTDGYNHDTHIEVLIDYEFRTQDSPHWVICSVECLTHFAEGLKSRIPNL